MPNTAARRRRSTEQLAALAALLDEDADLLKQHGFTHEMANRAMHVSHNRSPVITVHYHPDEMHYLVTWMRDGTKISPTAPDECARTIGRLVFEESTQR